VRYLPWGSCGQRVPYFKLYFNFNLQWYSNADLTDVKVDNFCNPLAILCKASAMTLFSIRYVVLQAYSWLEKIPQEKLLLISPMAGFA